MIYFILLLMAVMGYLFGSLNFAVIIGKLFYKTDVRQHGSAILLWTLLGYLTGGIGQLVADYFMIQNLNKTALVYNSRAY